MRTEQAIETLIAAGLVARKRNETIVGGTTLEEVGEGIFQYSCLFRIISEENGWMATCVVVGQKPTLLRGRDLSTIVSAVIKAYQQNGLIAQPIIR